MIIDAILDWIFARLEWLVGLLPEPGDLGWAHLDFSWITDLNYFLPISEMFGLFMSVIALGGPMAVVSLMLWVFVGVIRGGSPKS